MREILKISILVAMGLVIACCQGCSDDEPKTPISITAITNYTLDDHEIVNEAKLGQTLRVVGQGLMSLQTIYVNGQLVTGINKCYLTDYQLLLKLPTNIKLEDEMDDLTYLNSIRFVGTYNECIYSIRIYK